MDTLVELELLRLLPIGFEPPDKIRTIREYAIVLTILNLYLFRRELVHVIPFA